MLLLVFSFLAGLATILAPCIWPVLPIVFSTSIADKGKARPLGISLGVIISFAFFTLSAIYIVHLLHIDPNIFRIIAVIVLVFLGLMMLIPALSSVFEILVTRLSNLFGINKISQDNGFLSGFIAGVSLGIVWTPCAGPVLAAITALTATGKLGPVVILMTIFYAIGVGVPLFAIAYGSQKFIEKSRFLNSYTGIIQKVFGVIIILAAAAIYTNYDQTLQLRILNSFPALGNAVNSFETNTAVTNELNSLKNTVTLNPVGSLAPDFSGVTTWLNTDKPISIKDLRGKVVLVDFWTYTCINCIRTLPHVTGWYEKYKDYEFEVVGIHTPEFQFEHDTANVENAIKQYGINYPVGQDNNYAVWNAYSNQYWPAEYLIDAKGNIRKTDFGEGGYSEMESAIQSLLKENGANANMPLSNAIDTTPTQTISPETYLGSNRVSFDPNVSTTGNWQTTGEYIQSSVGSTLSYNFTASKVYIILNPSASGSNTVKVFLDSKQIDPTVAGVDVKNGIINVTSDRLYNVVDLGGKTETHMLKLEFNASGIQAYTFTFG